MPRQLRDTDPSKVHLITSRTLGAQLLLRPDKEVNEIIGGVLAKYQERYEVEIYAQSFLSNHFHLLCQASKANLHKFMACVKREIAKRVNRVRSRQGFLWGRRYDDQIVVEFEDELQALLYIVCNPVHHGLVSHPKLWPGVSSYQQLLGGPARTYLFTNYSEYNRQKRTDRSVKIRDFQKKYTLKLSPLPSLKDLTDQERIAKLDALIEGRTKELQVERRRQNKGFVGRRAVLKMDPYAFPREIKRSPRPFCYTKSAYARKCFLEEYFDKLARYLKASQLFRSGDFSVEFPPYCFKPSLVYASM